MLTTDSARFMCTCLSRPVHFSAYMPTSSMHAGFNVAPPTLVGELHGPPFFASQNKQDITHWKDIAPDGIGLFYYGRLTPMQACQITCFSIGVFNGLTRRWWAFWYAFLCCYSSFGFALGSAAARTVQWYPASNGEAWLRALNSPLNRSMKCLSNTGRICEVYHRIGQPGLTHRERSATVYLSR